MKSKAVVAVVVLATAAGARAAVPACGEGYSHALVCRDWQAGGAQWQSFDVRTKVTDWRCYDRASLKVANEGKGGATFSAYVGGAGRPHQYVTKTLRSCEWQTWTFKIALPKEMNPANVDLLHFYASQPGDTTIRIKDVVLLKEGEPAPSPDPADDAVFVPVLRRLFAGKSDECDRTAAELDELKRHGAAYLRFREDCQAAGQRGSLLLGTASTMERIRPRADLERPLRPADALSVRLARGEYEGVQLIVSPRTDALRNVRVEVGELKKDDGTAFFRTNVLCAVTGYFCIDGRSPYKVGRTVANKDGSYRRVDVVPGRGWYPEPILAYTNAADVAAMDFQGWWIRLFASPGQVPGVYRGEVRVTADGETARIVPIAVRVNAFQLPNEPPLPTAITWGPEYHAPDGEDKEFFRRIDQPTSPVRLWRSHKREWIDFLCDHYITMDCIYKWNDRTLDIPTFQHLKRRGRLAPVNLGFWGSFKDAAGEAKWRTNTLARIKETYAQLKAAGLGEYAYAYGCDEAPKDMLPQIRRATEILKRELPDVPLATTAYDHDFGVGTPMAKVDWFVPLIDKYDVKKAAASRAAGHKVWWYICCQPHAPYANMFVDSQAIEARLLQGAMAARMKPDGFLIYEIAIWNAAKGLSGGPFCRDWSPRTFRNFNGDGCWTAADAAGRPLPTIRMENYRDGVEDLLYVRLLEAKLAQRGKDDAWARRARELLAVPTSVMESMTNYTDDPAAVYAWRDAMADLLERP